MAVAALVLIAGSVGSALAASSVATRDADRARAAFATSAAHVASTLQLAIQHEEDLVYSAAGFVSGNPTATKADFARWQNATQALQRYPELLGLGEAVIVRNADLAGLREARRPGRHLHRVPRRCPAVLLLLGERVLAQPSTRASRPASICAPPARGPPGLAARDTGHAAYIPFGIGADTMLIVLSPVYRSGSLPRTVAARRSAFVGWVGMQIRPSVVLQRALQDQPGIAVTFSYTAYASHAVFQSGTVSHGARSATTDLHNGWTVRSVRRCLDARRVRQRRSPHRATRRHRSEPAARSLLAGARDRPKPRARTGAREDRRATYQGPARLADRVAEPRVDHGPRRAPHRPQPAQRQVGRRAVRRPRRLQERQRHARARSRRPAARRPSPSD